MDLIINIGRLAELERSTPEGRFDVILGLLLQEMAELLRHMRVVSDERGDFGDIARTLHGAAGSAAVFGLTGLRDALKQCEEAAVQRHRTSFERFTTYFEILLEQTKVALAQWQRGILPLS